MTRPLHHTTPEDRLFEFSGSVINGAIAEASDELAASVMRVNRALIAERATMPTELRNRLKEDIMTNAIALQTPVTHREYVPTVVPIRRRRSSRRVSPLYIAAAILLVMALVGGAFIANQQRTDHDDVPPAPAVVASPEGTSEANPIASTCDMSRDIPYLPGVESVPEGLQAVYLTPNSELRIQCADGTGGLLASDVSHARSIAPATLTYWQSLSEATAEEPADDPIVTWLNLTSGNRYTYGPITRVGQSESPRELIQPDVGPWAVVLANDEDQSPAVLDTRTMEVTLLADLIGHDLPVGTGVTATPSASGETTVVGLLTPRERDIAPSVVQSDDMPGGLLVLGSSIDTATWVPFPDGLEGVNAFAPSPDGTRIALTIAPQQSPTSQAQAFDVIVDAESGEELARNESHSTDNTFPVPAAVWMTDSSAILFQNQNQVMMLDANETPAIRTLYVGADDTTVSRFALNNSGDRILIDVQVDSRPQRTVLVDATDGSEMASVEGIAFSPPDFGEFVIVEGTQSATPRSLTLLLLSTGEAVPLESLAESTERWTSAPTVARTNSGEPVALAFMSGEVYRIERDADGTIALGDLPPRSEMRRVAGPTGRAMSISTDTNGTMLAFERQAGSNVRRQLLDLTDPDAQWIDIEGTREIPNFAVTTEFIEAPAMIVSPTVETASPVASPVTGEVPWAACMTDESIPVYPGTDVNPLDRPALLLGTDNVLRFDCEAGSFVVAEDVAYVYSIPGTRTLSLHPVSDDPASIYLTDPTYLHVDSGRTWTPATPERDPNRQADPSAISTTASSSTARLVRSESDPARLEFMDLTTLETTPLSDIVLNDPANDRVNWAISDNGRMLAVSIVGDVATPKQPTDQRLYLADLNQMGKSRWLTLPEDLRPGIMWLSPTGTSIALIDGMTLDALVFMDTATSNTLRTVDLASFGSTQVMTWSAADTLFIYGDGSSLMMADVTNDDAPVSLLETDTPIVTVRRTGAPSSVVATTESEAWRIDLSNRSPERLGGIILNTYGPTAGEILIGNPEANEIQLVDGARGSVLAAIPWEVTPGSLPPGQSLVVPASDGVRIAAFSPDLKSVFLRVESDGEVRFEQLAVPTIDSSFTLLTLDRSPDGSLVVAT